MASFFDDDKKAAGMKPKLILFGAVALSIAFVFFIVLSRWNYKTYQVKYTDNEENILAYEYYAFNGDVLKVASDTASYIDDNNNSFWTIAYSMTQPKAVFSGSSAAIYDLDGNTVVVCNAQGLVSTIKTSMPVVKAAVSEKGGSAVILDDGTDAWIEYYDPSGSRISSIKTTMDDTGYPFDLALSPNGKMLAVSYMCYEDSQMTTRMRFYNFGEEGKEKRDNMYASFSYTGLLIPQVEYLSSDICLGLTDNGAIIYKGLENPKEKTIIRESGLVISTIVNGSTFGLVVSDNGEIRLRMYNSDGKLQFDKNIVLAYTSIYAAGSDIVFYNRNQITVFSDNGSKKFEGAADELIRDIVPVGNNRFALITEEGFRLISLA